jgi:hypothetical protein
VNQMIVPEAIRRIVMWIKDKDKYEGIRKIENLIKGILSSREQCGEQKARRRREPVEAKRSVNRTVVMKETAVHKGGCPKRKMVSPAEIMRLEERKRPREGEVTYAKVCRKDIRNLVMDQEA